MSNGPHWNQGREELELGCQVEVVQCAPCPEGGSSQQARDDTTPKRGGTEGLMGGEDDWLAGLAGNWRRDCRDKQILRKHTKLLEVVWRGGGRGRLGRAITDGTKLTDSGRSTGVRVTSSPRLHPLYIFGKAPSKAFPGQLDSGDGVEASMQEAAETVIQE